MIRVIPALVIVLASLWLALPAAAQFEIDPDHFDFDAPATTVVQPRPTQAKKSVRVRLQHKQIQRDRVQAFKGTKNPTTATLTSSSAAAVQRRRRIGTSRVGQTRADTKPTKRPACHGLCSDRAKACIGKVHIGAFAMDGWEDVEVEC